jgi:hypothetical protein
MSILRLIINSVRNILSEAYDLAKQLGDSLQIVMAGRIKGANAEKD